MSQRLKDDLHAFKVKKEAPHKWGIALRFSPKAGQWGSLCRFNKNDPKGSVAVYCGEDEVGWALNETTFSCQYVVLSDVGEAFDEDLILERWEKIGIKRGEGAFKRVEDV